LNLETQNALIPVNVWIKTLVLMLVFFVGGFIMLEIRDRKIKNTPLLDMFTSVSNIDSTKLQPDFYIIGTSLTNKAFCKFNTLDSILKNEEDIYYKVVAKNSATPSECCIFIPEIIKLRPKNLIIESNIFCIDMSDKGLIALNLKLKEYSSRLARFPIFIFRNPKYITKIFSTPIPKEYIDKYVTIDKEKFSWELYSKRASTYSINSIDDFQEWNSFFKTARNLGINVVFLDLPRSKEAKQYFSKGFGNDYNKLINQYRQNFNIEYISFPDDLNFDKYYEDAAHFNYKGAKLYTEWFVKEIIPKLKKH
jgi:hypothetical protein